METSSGLALTRRAPATMDGPVSTDGVRYTTWLDSGMRSKVPASMIGGPTETNRLHFVAAVLDS